METKDTQIEGLEEIAGRLIDDCWVSNDWGSSAIDYKMFAQKLLADPAILAHIPAVKALQDQIEFTKQQVTGEVENAGYFKERYQDMQSLADKQSQRIATLEAQLADERLFIKGLQAQLAGGEPVAWRPIFNTPSDFTTGKPSQETIDYWFEQGVLIEYAYANPKPAIAGKVPPGYVQIGWITRGTVLNERWIFTPIDEQPDVAEIIEYRRTYTYEGKLQYEVREVFAPSPSAPIAEGDQQ